MTTRRTHRRPVTRKRHTKRIKIGSIKININRKTFVMLATIIFVPFIMGAACSGLGGSGVPIWENPAQPVEDVKVVLDANGKAIEDIGNGAAKVGDWGEQFAKGWSDADARRKGHKAPESAEEPPPVPACDWSEFGPCDEPPPLAWFGITDDNANGVPDDKE